MDADLFELYYYLLRGEFVVSGQFISENSIGIVLHSASYSNWSKTLYLGRTEWF